MMSFETANYTSPFHRDEFYQTESGLYFTMKNRQFQAERFQMLHQCGWIQAVFAELPNWNGFCFVSLYCRLDGVGDMFHIDYMG